MSLGSVMDLSALRDEIERYKSLPRLMNLYEKVNGFFDSKFESYWEDKTGTPWKEWGKL
jgi:C4-dicarboxylate-specific signal transduction histidine kinase